MEAVAMDMSSAFACFGVPHSQTAILIASRRYDTLPVGRELARRDWALVTRKYLQITTDDETEDRGRTDL